MDNLKPFVHFLFGRVFEKIILAYHEDFALCMDWETEDLRNMQLRFCGSVVWMLFRFVHKVLHSKMQLLVRVLSKIFSFLDS